MRKSRCRYIILLLLLSGLQACQKPGCFENAGTVSSVERKATAFHQIDLYDHIDLILTQDTVEKIRVEAGANLQPNIATEIIDGVLVIRNNTTCKWLRDPQEKISVYVSFKMLNRINYDGSGNVRATDTLHLPQLRISSNTGAGNVELTVNTQLLLAYIHHENADYIIRGIADQCHSYTNARGTIDFSDLKVRYYNIGYSAPKNTYIQASERIDAEIYFKGNVYYKGDPEVKTIYHDAGRLIKAP
jgi:hypothetical protein